MPKDGAHLFLHYSRRACNSKMKWKVWEKQRESNKTNHGSIYKCMSRAGNNAKVQHSIWRVSCLNVQNNGWIRWCRLAFLFQHIKHIIFSDSCELGHETPIRYVMYHAKMNVHAECMRTNIHISYRNYKKNRNQILVAVLHSLHSIVRSACVCVCAYAYMYICVSITNRL